MHFDFARKWSSLQKWSHWDFLRRINTQLFPLLVCLHFYFTQNVISSLLLILGFIFNSFNFQIRFQKPKQSADLLDPIFELHFKERLVFLYSFLICLFFLFLKLLLMTTVWFNFMPNLSESVYLLVSEVKVFLVRITPFILDSLEKCQTDMILQSFFILYLGATYLLNRRSSNSYNHYTLQITLFSVNQYFSGALLLMLVAVFFVKICFFFSVSVASFMEVFLVIFSILCYWFALHRKAPQSKLKFVKYLRTLSILRLLLFITFLAIKQIGNSNLPFDFLELISPELVATSSNYELACQLFIYLCSSLYCWCCKFRANFTKILDAPIRKNISSNSHFIKYFALEFLNILDTKSSKIGNNLYIKQSYFNEFKKSRHFIRTYRKTARLNNTNRRKNLSFLNQLLLNTKDLVSDIFNTRFFLGRFLLLSMVLIFLAMNSFSICLFSVLNFSMILVIVLFPRLTAISNSCLLLLLLPHLFFMVIYTLLFMAHSTDWFPRMFMLPLLKMLSTMGMETSPDKVLTNFLLHFEYAFVGTLILLVLRIFFKKKTQSNTIITRSSFFFFIIDFCCYLTQFSTLFSILLETLYFPNICNLGLLLSMYAYLVLSRRSAKVVAWTMLLIFSIRFFSRFKLIFGFFENTSNLLFGLYFNIKQVVSFNLVPPSPENVFYFNLTRMLLLLLSSKYLSDQPPNKSRIKNSFIAPLLNVCKNILGLLSSIKVFFVYFSVFFLALVSPQLSFLDYSEICYCSFLLLLDMLLFKSHLKRSSSFFIFFFAIYFIYSFGILIYTYFTLFSGISSNSEQHMNNFMTLLPLTIKLIFSTISFQEFLRKFFVSTPHMVSTVGSDSNYYLVMRILSVFLREVLLFYTLVKFLQTPNLFKVIYLGSYLFYFCYQISDLASTLSTFQLRQLIASKIYYFHVCFISNLDPDTHVPNVPNGLFRRLFPHCQILYSRLFSRAIFKSLYGVIKRTWILLFLSLLIYLQALFFLEIYIDNCKINPICKVIFNLKFDQTTAIKSELFQVVLVLMITVAELYFVNILRSKEIPNENQLVRAVSNLCIGFFQFRATASNKSLQLDLQNRFMEKHAHVVARNFDKFKEILQEDSEGKIREFAELSNQLLLQFSSFHQ